MNNIYSEIELKFYNYYGKSAQYIFCSPGRTELAGNHTDHQNGRVIAGAIDALMTSAVSFNCTKYVNIYSDGFGFCSVCLDSLDRKEDELGTTVSIVRGILSYYSKLAKINRGFDAYITSELLPGSGLSSSAAFENLISCIVNSLYEYGLDPVEIAKISKFSENNYFGKPCGLMDQLASSLGGISVIDFMDPQHPVVKSISIDFRELGYELCIINSGASHENLTDEYSMITDDLSRVCSLFGKTKIRELDEEKFNKNTDFIREKCGERALKRAQHVFSENRRVIRQAAALENKNIVSFLSLVNESGESSKHYLQNIVPINHPENNQLSEAIEFVKSVLDGRGACRVHGGGFAGTIQAYVPCYMLDEFTEKIEEKLGIGSCMVVKIRNTGSGLVKKIYD